MSEILIRRLMPHEATDVVELVRASFDPRLLSFMIYGQRGMPQYLADTCSGPALDTEREYWLAVRTETGDVVAFADFDLRHRDVPHLAYICVADSARGHGLAARMIRTFAAEHPLASSLSLNVFDDNLVAQRLYARLGFSETGRSVWQLRPAPKPHGTLRARDYAQSLAMHARYGFSRLHIVDEDKPVLIGRMGDSCVSVTSRGDFENGQLLGRIRSAFPSIEHVMHIVSNEAHPEPLEGQTTLLRSIAMTASFPLPPAES